MANAIFSGVRAKWLPLYERLYGMAREKLGAFDVHETPGAVLWRHNSTFAEIGARKDCMVVAFASNAAHDAWEPAKVLRTSKNRVVHYFEATDDARFSELVARIAEAYALTQSNRAPKKPAEKPGYATVDEYIALFPPEARAVMEKARAAIREAAPDAAERIRWGMPTFYLNGNLVHFAAAQKHLGFYPGESGISAFAEKLGGYRFSKGAAQFPFDKPVPYELIAEITRFRAQEQRAVRDRARG